MTTPTNPDEATIPTTTPTFKPIKVTWLFWYGWIIIGLSAIALQDVPVPYMLLGMVVNFVLFFVPAWLITQLIRWLRRR